MQFFSAFTLAIAIFSSAGTSFLANANPIKRQSNQTITITNFAVEIIREDTINSTSFTIQTSTENITCGASELTPEYPTSCTSNPLWTFMLVDDEHNDAVNLTLSTTIANLTVSGETAITLYCMGVPDAVVETAECVSLAAVESGGHPTTITLI